MCDKGKDNANRPATRLTENMVTPRISSTHIVAVLMDSHVLKPILGVQPAHDLKTQKLAYERKTDQIYRVIPHEASNLLGEIFFPPIDAQLCALVHREKLHNRAFATVYFLEV